MKKHYTLAEYCRRFKVDSSTLTKIQRLSLLQSRMTGGNGITRSSKKPLKFWKELHSKAENTRSRSTFFYSVPGYIRKTPGMKNVTPGDFYSFMKEHYKAFKARIRYGSEHDDLVFLYADLQSGGKQFLNNPEGPAPQKRQETPAPEPVTVPERGARMAFSASEGHGLLGFMLGALSGAAVGVACVLCCF